MKRTKVMRWSLAAVVGASLAFGTAQAFAAPGARQTSSSCEPWDCRGQCGVGCGGTCVNSFCECDC
jgi:hypothetical protein